ncbi:Flp family type IVb pilin [Sphingomonas rhizophila]|uniref:Flp family type IVb pilin n=1 Tax=Sphingomonas rhizophila TaxID=2071607 RepID=UPI003CCD607F
MLAIRSNFRRFRASQKGATAIEYGLIAALIVVAMIGALGQLGGGAGGMWTKVRDAVLNNG